MYILQMFIRFYLVKIQLGAIKTSQKMETRNQMPSKAGVIANFYTVRICFVKFQRAAERALTWEVENLFACV